MSKKYDINAITLSQGKYRSLHAGDSYTHGFTVTRSNAPLDLTGAKIWFTIKETSQQQDTQAKLQLSSDDVNEIEITDAVGGKFDVKFTGSGAKSTSDLEGSWLYDLQIKLSTGEVITLVYGKIEFLRNITRSTV